MASISCIYSSRAALYRVFVSPLERRLVTVANRPANLAPLGLLAQTRSYAVPARNNKDRKSQAATIMDEDIEEKTSLFTSKEAIAKRGRDRMPQDFEITDPKIMVVADGVRDGPFTTKHVLARLEPGQSLRMVQPYVPAAASRGVGEELALCKIVNLKDEYRRQREQRERKRVAKATTVKTKEMELNWSISDHDLGTKMRQLTGFLNKGMKVDVMFGRKKNNKKVTDDEAAEVLKKVRKAVEELRAKETKPADGTINKKYMLFLEGVAVPK